MTLEPRPSLIIETAKLVRALQGYYADERIYPGDLSRTVLSRLGCTQNTQLSPRLTTPSVEDMPDVPVCLLMVLLEMANSMSDAPNAATSVLGAIGKYNGWQKCTATEDGAYALAIALVFYAGYYTEGGSLTWAVASDVTRILEGWLGLEITAGIPSINAVCQRMFGPAWCGLMLSDETLLGGEEGLETDEKTCAKVARQRPPFMPGLCAAQLDIIEIDLPVMEQRA